MPKKGATVIRKLLISAVANAEHAGQSDVDQLLIRDCSVDNGPILKRWMPRSMGRANRIQHRTSHVTVVVSFSLSEISPLAPGLIAKIG